MAPFWVHQFPGVDLQDVAAQQRLFNDFLGIELPAQVDVKDLQAVMRRGIKEPMDGLTAHHVAPGQRTEAHGAAVAGKLLDVIIEGNVVTKPRSP